MKLAIAAEADLIMRKDAIEAFPNECCGFMYGYDTETERVIEKAIPVINSKEGDQRRRFEINPFDYMKAESYALKHNTTLLGVYHSHPQHPAIASETDLKSAMPFFSYVIYSVMDGKINDVKSWQLIENGESFYEEEVLAQLIIKNE
ncbi:MAG: M67 family metallopeptidase [Bacteroidetes bacterium]|nr:M67 family metallopeptidase [Bacteroidota bacterium]